ncbi:MAG TPA: hybrid sensor histidine kinase/response regulator [Kamptonema sp.]|nr:hybrid sensor histidine kinase/response regulator [Kamptonema sp.]
MSIPSPTLHNFIEAVPVCFQTDRLSVLRSIFRQQKCDRVAVVNDQHQLQGLVYFRSWMHRPLISYSRGSHRSQQLSTLNSRIVEPALAVSADLSLNEFWLWLQEQQWQEMIKNQEKNNEFNYLAEKAENWVQLGENGSIAKCSHATAAYLLPPPNQVPIALIDPSGGQFVGLLDSLRLLKFIALEKSNKGDVSERSAQAKTIKTEEKAALRYRSAPKIPNILPLAEKPTIEIAQTCSFNLHSFVQLLEKLPLPLRLLSADGQIISQNSAWKLLLGAGPEPDLITTATPNSSQPFSHLPGGGSTKAETPVPEKCRSGGPAALTEEDRRSPLTLAYSTSTAPSWCAIAAKPDTYTCSRPADRGSESIWQFVTQPLSETLTLVLAQDVTEEQLVAKELAAKNADLIQLNRLKDEFLACISHELKTPLTAVLGLSSLLKDRAIGELNDRQARYAKLIHQSGRHLMTVVNDILDLTRIETGQMELIVEQVAVAAVCDRAFEGAKLLQQQEEKSSPNTSRELNLSEPQSKIEFTLEIEPGLAYIVADELRLRQMLVNLLSNALKFTESGGKIGLKVNLWEGWIAFTVWDTGIGIPEDKQHLIFQKFQQLESPLTRRFQGTGLGLVLTQRLARLHGGDVSFISSEGQGSQFTLLLPPCPPGTKGQGNRVAEAQGSRGEKISDLPISPSPHLSVSPSPHLRPSARLVLIVEAVPRFIEDLTNLLTGLGYRVLVARSGTEALEKARRFSPEVIFLNPLLPLLSGWDVLTLLKTDAETCSIPAIVTATRGEKERATLHKADGFLSLPVKEVALLGQLSELTQPPQPMTVDDLKNSLTVLLLSPLNSSFHAASFLLHPSYCRVLEADDLDQAELLARIWHPNVMVLESASSLENPAAFVEELSHRRSLVTIPLVTLDPTTTQLANQIKGLSVFPCLAAGDRTGAATPGASGPIASALWQVIQVAGGMTWKPSILLVDVSSLFDLPPSGEESQSGEFLSGVDSEVSLSSQSVFPIPNSQLLIPNSQALSQYLQTAGFRSAIAGSWAEVLQQLQYQSVDLLLICLRENSSPSLVQALSNLRQMPAKAPILVLDYRCDTNRESQVLTSVLGEIAAQIFPSSLSVAELLQQIEQTLKNS